MTRNPDRNRRLRAAREATRWSTEQMASELGVTEQWMRRCLYSESTPGKWLVWDAERLATLRGE